MKKVLFILFELFNYLGSGQNLVRNPSFEDHSNCPDAPSQIDYSLYWQSFRGSVDYYHSCSTTPGFAPPNTQVSYQIPHSGSSFAGFSGWAWLDYREIIGNLLSTTLIIGQRYYFSFYVNYAFRSISYNLACNQIGIRFSTNPYSTINPVPINNYAVFKTDSIISDTVSWFKLSGSFVADSAYNYVMIGNFFVNDSTDTIHLSNDVPVGAYYFLDDVCVSTDSIYNETWTALSMHSENEEAFNAYPNPFTNQITFATNNRLQASLILYNSLGQIMKHEDFIHTIFLSTEEFKSGFYFYELRYQNGEIKNGKLIKN